MTKCFTKCNCLRTRKHFLVFYGFMVTLVLWENLIKLLEDKPQGIVQLVACFSGVCVCVFLIKL